MKLLIALLVAAAAMIAAPSSADAFVRIHDDATTAPSAPSQGELTRQAIDLFILSDPPCKVADFEFFIRPKLVLATCDRTRFDDFAGMGLVNGTWTPGIYDTGR